MTDEQPAKKTAEPSPVLGFQGAELREAIEQRIGDKSITRKDYNVLIEDYRRQMQELQQTVSLKKRCREALKKE